MLSGLHCVRFLAVVCSNHLGGPASPDLLSRFHTRTAVQAQPWHEKAVIDVPLKAGTLDRFLHTFVASAFLMLIS